MKCIYFLTTVTADVINTAPRVPIPQSVILPFVVPTLLHGVLQRSWKNVIATKRVSFTSNVQRKCAFVNRAQIDVNGPLKGKQSECATPIWQFLRFETFVFHQRQQQRDTAPLERRTAMPTQ